MTKIYNFLRKLLLVSTIFIFAGYVSTAQVNAQGTPQRQPSPQMQKLIEDMKAQMRSQEMQNSHLQPSQQPQQSAETQQAAVVPETVKPEVTPEATPESEQIPVVQGSLEVQQTFEEHLFMEFAEVEEIIEMEVVEDPLTLQILHYYNLLEGSWEMQNAELHETDLNNANHEFVTVYTPENINELPFFDPLTHIDWITTEEEQEIEIEDTIPTGIATLRETFTNPEIEFTETHFSFTGGNIPDEMGKNRYEYEFLNDNTLKLISYEIFYPKNDIPVKAQLHITLTRIEK